jgi:HK97 family phage major capsid protein
MTDTDQQDGRAQQDFNVWRSLQSIEAEQKEAQAQLRKLADMQDPEQEDFILQETLIQRFDALETQAAPLRKRAEDIQRIAQRAVEWSNLEQTTPVVEKLRDKFRTQDGRVKTPDMTTRSFRDPFDNIDAVRAKLVPRSEVAARAKQAIEDSVRHYDMIPDQAEAATEKIDLDPRVASHVLLTGTEEYLDAYRAYLRDPSSNSSRAALSLTAANGGYLLPYVLDPTIILTNAGSANPYRRIGNVKTTTSNAWQGVSSAGVNAALLAEAQAATDSTPTVGQIQIFPEKAAAWVYGSYEALEDEDFGTQLPRLLADAKDRLEEGQFTTGAGHGSSQALGLLTAIAGTGQRVGSVNGTGTGAFPQNTDVYNLIGSLPPRFRGSANAAWLANIAYINKIRGIDTAGGSSFWANFGQSQPEQLLGKSIFEESSLTSATATGTGTGSAALVFGDFDQFLIIDRVGVSMIYEPMVKSIGTGTPGFPTGQSGWFMFWRFSSGVSTSNAFRYLTSG